MRIPLARTLATASVTALLGAGLVGVGGPAAVAVDKPARQLALPDGFQPEGIAIGADPRPTSTGADRTRDVAYLGSRVDGDVIRVDLATGKIKRLYQGPGTPSLGLKVDERDRLFVAGGSGGDARVLDARTGEVKASYRLVEGTSFINDVVLTKDAAWFTDSANAQLFTLPFQGRNDRLPRASDVVRLPLGGDWVQRAGVNGNGLTASPDGKALLVVNSASGELFRVSTRTGAARLVDLRGTLLTNGDGLLLENRTLYAVQNRLNQVAVVRLSKDGRTGRLKRIVTSNGFDVPTTVARSGKRLYLPNARFSTPPTPTTTYAMNGVKLPVAPR